MRDAIGPGDSSLETDKYRDLANRGHRPGASLGEEFRPSLEPVINASGVIIHTNLGRAAGDRPSSGWPPWRGYSTLEYDLGRGTVAAATHAGTLLCRLTRPQRPSS